MGALDQLIATQYQRNAGPSPMQQIAGMQGLERGKLQNQALSTDLQQNKTQQGMKFAANVAQQINDVEDPAKKSEIYSTALQVAKMNGHDISQFPPQYDERAQSMLDVMHMQVYAPQELEKRMNKAGIQFGGQIELKDDEGNLFFATTKRNPNNGMIESSIVPIGDAQKPVGGLQIVSGSGMTPDEKVTQTREIEQVKQDVKGRTEPQIQAAIKRAVNQATLEADTLATNRSNESALSVYNVGMEGLLDALGNTNTGPVVGRLPAMSANAQIAEGAQAAMAPILKQMFRAAGEGTFTDNDQKMLMDMLPTRSDHPEAAKAKLENIDAIVRAKLATRDPKTGELGQTSQTKSQYQEGQTATNPQTGERIIFRNGQWQPAS